MIKSSNLNKNIPAKPGIYLFKSKQKILYIGKAKNLNNRVKQYFQEKGNPVIENLLQQADEIETIITDDEKDALHLEYNLIHTYLPPFNVKLKDDKTFPFIEISTTHEFPGIYFSRQVNEKNFSIGPITNSRRTRDLIDIISRLFKIRTCTDQTLMRGIPCLYFHLDRCTAPCTLRVRVKANSENKSNRDNQENRPDKEEKIHPEASAYKKNVEDAINFLQGKKNKILKNLQQKMRRSAQELKFEEAQQIKEDIELIETFSIDSYISSAAKTDYDVLSLYLDTIDNQENDCFVILFSILRGRVRRREVFNYFTLHSAKEETLKEFLISFYRKENIPDEILLPFLPTDVENIQELFSRLVNRKINIKIPAKGDKKKLLDLAVNNLNLYVSRNRFSTIGQKIKEKLQLEHFPKDIEAYDISHFSERKGDRVGAVVTFSNGKAVKKKYRSYIIKEAPPGDVFALKEVLQRRFKNKAINPDLLVIDGGLPQLNAALEIKKKCNIRADIVAIAKEEERIFLEKGGSIIFPPGSPELFLLQEIRDEVHRRAITHHKLRRDTI